MRGRRRRPTPAPASVQASPVRTSHSSAASSAAPRPMPAPSTRSGKSRRGSSRAARALHAERRETAEERAVRREHGAALRVRRRHDAGARGLLRARRRLARAAARRREEIAEEHEAAHRDVGAAHRLRAHAELLARGGTATMRRTKVSPPAASMRGLTSHVGGGPPRASPAPRARGGPRRALRAMRRALVAEREGEAEILHGVAERRVELLRARASAPARAGRHVRGLAGVVAGGRERGPHDDRLLLLRASASSAAAARAARRARPSGDSGATRHGAQPTTSFRASRLATRGAPQNITTPFTQKSKMRRVVDDEAAPGSVDHVTVVGVRRAGDDGAAVRRGAGAARAALAGVLDPGIAGVGAGDGVRLQVLEGAAELNLMYSPVCHVTAMEKRRPPWPARRSCR